jgi:hypothetical protein
VLLHPQGIHFSAVTEADIEIILAEAAEFVV